MSTEAMKLALETLKMVDCDDNDRSFLSSSQCYQLDKAITALQEALAQPQQEPVAEDNSNYRLDPPGLDPRYTSPPAQRKPLTDEEIDWMTRGNNYPGTVPGARRFARAIEAKHGIKEQP